MTPSSQTMGSPGKPGRFREPLDATSLLKLREHFRTMHVFHSVGIEGNRLTLQETRVALEDGIDISGKPLKDVIEVRSLAEAFDFLEELCKQTETIRETDIRSLHKLVVDKDPAAEPGTYRKVGVLISGADHRPPEPLDVPIRMVRMVDRVNENLDAEPLVLASLAHHELAAIHPFLDGNGRVSRLVMNLLLMKAGYPICNIRREDRPAYYEALAFADVGLHEPLITLVMQRVDDLLREYQRLRQENRRTREWAEKWKATEANVLRRREQLEYELWRSRTHQVRLEFEKAATLLSDGLKEIAVDFNDYNRDIDFDTYQTLRVTGKIDHSHAFAIQLFHRPTRRRERFMFRYFRNWNKFAANERVVPLEVNYFEGESWKRLCDLPQFAKIKLREVFFDDSGRLVTIEYDLQSKGEKRHGERTIEQIVRVFLDDVLREMMGLVP